MHDIHKSMNIPELNLKPPIEGTIKLTTDMQQTLALLTAYGNSTRKVLKASESGVLYTASSRIRDIVHIAGAGAGSEKTGDNVPCTECLVMGHPDNTGRVWVRPDKTASQTNAWPLDAGEVVGFTLNNLNQLNMLIVEAGEKVIIAYSR